MAEHDDAGVEGMRRMPSEEWPEDETSGVHRADPLVEGAPVGGGLRTGTAAGDEPGTAGTTASEADHGIPVAPDDSGHAWAGAATGAGLALIVIELLVLLGTVAQGLAVERLDGDILHKVGVAFLSNVGTANGLTILVGAVLAALPALVGARLTTTQNSRRALALSLGAVLALIVILATPIAVRARLHVLDIGNQPVDALARRVLATYTIGTLGTAAVALGACLGLARAGAGAGRSAEQSAGGQTASGPGETVTPHP